MDNTQELILKGHWCPYCDRATKMIEAKEIYGREGYGWAYVCEQCFSYCGCHKGTTESLGSIANEPLRRLRNQTHAIYDPIWRKLIKTSNYSKHEARNACYMWLARLMGIEPQYCHIGMFTEQQCLDAIHLITKFNPFKDELRKNDELE